MERLEDPTPEQLQKWANDCHVRVDQPNLERFVPLKPGGRKGAFGRLRDAFNTH